jgi:hypothetical protein
MKDKLLAFHHSSFILLHSSLLLYPVYPVHPVTSFPAFPAALKAFSIVK